MEDPGVDSTMDSIFRFDDDDFGVDSGRILGWILKMILGRIFCRRSFNMKDSGIDSAMDSDSDLMMDSGVDSGSALLWRILGLIILF